MSGYKFTLINYDGINLFKDGDWTKLEVPSVEEGQHLIGFLETLSKEQADHWIRVQLYLKESNKTFNALKYNKKYSGQTTCYPHIRSAMDGGEEWKETPGIGADCIQAQNVFEAQWTNCPVEVEKEVKRLWREEELGNDFYYYSWDTTDEDVCEEEDLTLRYPIIAEYLKARGIKKCLIHWWW